MTSQECIQRKTDTKQETALGFILLCGKSESESSWIVDNLKLFWQPQHSYYHPKVLMDNLKSTSFHVFIHNTSASALVPGS